MSEPIAQEGTPTEASQTMPFFPNFLLRDLLLWLIVLNILAVLAVFFPWELGTKADAFAPAPAGIRPEWYFLFMFQTLKNIPAQVWIIDGEVLGIMLFGLGALLWTLVPFWDRQSAAGHKSRTVTYLGIFVVFYIIAFTIFGWVE
jgi:cytochrome b6